MDKGNDQAYKWDFPGAESLKSCDLTAGVIVLCLRAYCLSKVVVEFQGYSYSITQTLLNFLLIKGNCYT